MNQEGMPPHHRFGEPLFNDPEARALRRVGVVDVGSNSVRLVIFDGAARSPAYFYNEKVMCGLGAGLQETGRLNPEGRARALIALRRFQALAESLGITPLTTVATAAMRDAEDGPAFCDQVRDEIGMELNVIDGAEEARLSAQGVLLGWPGSEGLICDIGGASMELARIHAGEVGARMTSDLGPLKLGGMGRNALEKHIAACLTQMHQELGTVKGERLFLVGGSWRAIAKIDIDRRGYPMRVLHEYRMTPSDVRHTLDQIAHSDPTNLRQRCGVSAARMALVPLAGQVLRQLVATFRPKDICISTYGIREGVLYEQMPQKLRDRDPLIEASWFLENRDARFPGFGAKLFDFVMPLFPRVSPAHARIIQAACLLHDVCWRSHPDYRAEVCFDMATRANLGGLTHAERVFLGLALMYRYSSKPPAERFAPILALLSDKERTQAAVLGKAMRLGAMLWHSPETRPAWLHWRPGKRVLELHLGPDAEPLFGEVAQARLESICSSLNAEYSLHIT